MILEIILMETALPKQIEMYAAHKPEGGWTDPISDTLRTRVADRYGPLKYAWKDTINPEFTWIKPVSRFLAVHGDQTDRFVSFDEFAKLWKLNIAKVHDVVYTETKVWIATSTGLFAYHRDAKDWRKM